MSLPIPIGGRKVFTPTQLAERAVNAISDYKTPRRRNAQYGFFMDHKGRTWLDKPPDVLDAQWLMTITRKTCPDDIAAEIWEAEK